MVDRQALLVFVPYLLIVLASGTRSVASRVVVAAPLAIVLFLFFAASTWYFHEMPSSPRDYAAIAGLINARLKEDDVIFVQPKKWYVTPIFYYLDPSRLIAKDYSAYTAQRQRVRVWVVLFGRENSTPEMAGALQNFHLRDQVTALGARGLLYEKP
jgi:hypothetical protein